MVVELGARVNLRKIWETYTTFADDFVSSFGEEIHGRPTEPQIKSISSKDEIVRDNPLA